MGKIKKGILGGFSGRVGNVIGGSWKGIDYMRSEATSISDPKTAKQLEQRSKFRVAVEFAKNCVPLINVGLKQYATKRSEFNYLVSKICKDWWDEETQSIPYSLVQLSATDPTAEVSKPIIGSATRNNDVVRVDYTDEYGGGEDAILCGLLYLPDFNYYSLLLPSQMWVVSESYCEFSVPTYPGTTPMYCYLFIYDTAINVCSDTAYSFLRV